MHSSDKTIEKGMTVRVIARTDGHGFEVGETLHVTAVSKKKGTFIATNGEEKYALSPHEVEVVKTALPVSDKLTVRGQVKLESWYYLKGVSEDLRQDIVERFTESELDRMALHAMLTIYRDAIVRELQLERCLMHNILKEDPK